MKAVINKIESVLTGASIPPEAMMHFPPVSDFPPVFEKIFDFLENFKNFTFPEKISHFHPPKFLTTFILVINHKFRIFTAFPPLNRENLLFPPTFLNFPPVFEKFNSYLHTSKLPNQPPRQHYHIRAMNIANRLAI